MRYYKGHTILCQSYFTFFVKLLIRSIIFFFQSHISYGIPGLQVSQSTTVLVFHPSFLRGGGGGNIDASFKKKDLFYWMKGEKKTGTWWHAPCCYFKLVWWICYFISTRKISLLLGKVEFCVVMTVNIHIWKVKWKKIKRNLWNKTKTQDVCLACFMLVL